MDEKVNKTRIICLALLIASSSLYMFHIGIMWQTAIVGARDGSITTGVFVETSYWLSSHLGANETALIPMPMVFHITSPELVNRLIPYDSLWRSAGVILQANTTEAEIIYVRNYLVGFLNSSPEVRYVVHDWNDPYDVLLFHAKVNDTLMLMLHEVKTISFTLSTGWSNGITIYERS